MSVYMVERNFKGISMEDLAAAQKTAIAKANENVERRDKRTLHPLHLRA